MPPREGAGRHGSRTTGRTRSVLTGLRRALTVFFCCGALLVVLVPKVEDLPAQPTIVDEQVPLPSLSLTDADRQAELVGREDQRLLDVVSSIPFGAAPFTAGSGPDSTTVLTRIDKPYDLAALVALGVVQPLSDGSQLLVHSLLVAPGATLELSLPGSTLRLASNATGFASLVTWRGRTVLTGTAAAPMRVTSWDSLRAQPDDAQMDGRAYLRAVSGRMDLAHVVSSDLGFWSGRTGGASWTGSATGTATGTVTSSTFERNYYGAFLSRTRNLRVTGSTFRGNDLDGLALHRESRQIDVSDSAVTDNGRNGIAASRGAERVVLAGVEASRNGANGILLDGQPLASGPTASGVPLGGYGNSSVTGGRVANNASQGVLVRGGQGVTVRDVEVTGNLDGISVEGPATGHAVLGNRVRASTRFAVTLDAATRDTVVADNVINGAVTAIRVRNSAVAVRMNEIQQASGHAVSAVGAAGGSVVRDNIAAGRARAPSISCGWIASRTSS